MYSALIDEVPSIAFVTEDNRDVCVNTIPHGTTSLPLKALDFQHGEANEGSGSGSG